MAGNAVSVVVSATWRGRDRAGRDGEDMTSSVPRRAAQETTMQTFATPAPAIRATTTVGDITASSL